MSDEKAGPRVIHFTPGQPLATEPHVASYRDELDSATFAAIDAAHPQDTKSQGRCLSAFSW